MLNILFFAIGLVFLLRGFLELFNIFLSLFCASFKFPVKPGTWAVITACTDGLGLGFSEELAKKGFNIVQIGRNPSKLNKTAQLLKDTYNISVRSIAKDFEKTSDNPISFFLDIEAQLSDLPISLIVNNIGVGFVKSFTSQGQMLYTSLALNIFPIIFLTRIALKQLSLQENGGIINVGSIACLTPIQKNTVYAAAKAAQLAFSEVLHIEMGYQKKFTGNDIKVLCLLPALIETPATEYLKSKPMVLNKYQCAGKAIGLLGRVSYSSGHWKHQVMYIAMSLASLAVPFFGEEFNKPYEITTD